jgi:YidC/Oxa1 family membrane protein insertase
MGEMEKRLVIFLVLSVAIVSLFTFFGPAPTPPPPTPAPSHIAAPTAAGSPPSSSANAPATPEAAETPSHPAATVTPAETVTIDTPLYRASLTTAGGVFTRWELKQYTETVKNSDPVVLYPPLDRPPVSAPLSIEIAGVDSTLLNGTLYHFEGGDAQLTKEHPSARVRMTASLPLQDGSGRTVTVEKELLFHSDTYRVDLMFKVDGIVTPYYVSLGDSFGLHQALTQQQGFIGHRGAVSMIGGELVLDKPDKLPAPKIFRRGVDSHHAAR